MTARAAPMTEDRRRQGAATRRAEALAQWRRHSARIQLARLILPALMAGLIALLAAWIGVRAVLSAVNTGAGAIGAVHMSHAHFHGRDEHGRPFVLSSEIGVRDGVDVNKITLTKPDFAQSVEPGQPPRRMTGDSGVYREEQRQLFMSGRVTFDDGKGAKFFSDHATLNMNDGSVVGDTAVHGDSPLGHFEASSYSVDSRGEHSVFRGRVKGHFLTQQDQGK